MSRFDKTISDVSFKKNTNKERAQIQLSRSNSHLKKMIKRKITVQNTSSFIVPWQHFDKNNF